MKTFRIGARVRVKPNNVFWADLEGTVVEYSSSDTLYSYVVRLKLNKGGPMLLNFREDQLLHEPNGIERFAKIVENG